jgi:lipoyl(octanoyl) transferase
MDLKPFEMINPCGYQGLQTVDLATLNKNCTVSEVSDKLIHQLKRQLQQHA